VCCGIRTLTLSRVFGSLEIDVANAGIWDLRARCGWWRRVDSNHGPTDYENTAGFCTVWEMLYSIPLFNGLELSRFDPFRLEMIPSDR
jgi:hypothetical protein